MFKDYRGFRMFIGEQSEYPVMSERGKLIDTGHVTNIQLSGIHFDNKNMFKSM